MSVGIDTPCGVITIEHDGRRVTAVRFTAWAGTDEDDSGFGLIIRSLLERYFAGEPVELDLPVDLDRVSPSDKRVYELLREVRRGQLISYKELAMRWGNPRAARYIGQAMARNPVPLFVPCHRAIAHDSRPGGFGPGLEWKRYLLELEGASALRWTTRSGS